MKDPYQIIKRPVITEKSTWLKELNREICFEVDSRANKIEIKEATEKLFNVKVDRVRIVKKKGKTIQKKGQKKDLAQIILDLIVE